MAKRPTHPVYLNFAHRKLPEIASTLEVILLKPDERMATYLNVEQALQELFATNDFCFQKCLSQDTSLYPIADPPEEFKSSVPGKHGCCIENSYELPTPFKAIEDVVARFTELQEENSECQDESGCKYHSEDGCQITQYRSPECLAYLCPSYMTYLRTEYSINYPNAEVNRRLQWILFGWISKEETDAMVSKIEQATERIQDHKEPIKYELLTI